MSLLLAMLPFYVLGNFHCIGMCGPLVVFLGRHRYRYLYFLGRTLSFSLAGLTAGALGSVLQIWLKTFFLPAIVSLLFGSIMMVFGFCMMSGKSLGGMGVYKKLFASIDQKLSLLLLRDQPYATFFFGFATVFLPCGQTLIVFSACALSQSAAVGLMNGLAFALLTSPSLWLAMRAARLVNRWNPMGNRLLGGCAAVVGGIALLRGLAELDWVPHLIINKAHHMALF
jgi:sulfite exporter TauE/SafE